VRFASRAAIGAAAASGFVLFLCACASSGGSPAGGCAGFVPPKILALGAAKLPPEYVGGRLGATVIDEVVIRRDGTVADVRMVATYVTILAPFSEAALRRGRFAPGSIEGNPVAVRAAVTIPIGQVRTPKYPPAYDTLRAFVPGGESREARWQLAGSVERLTLVAHLGSPSPEGAGIVAVAPDGAEKVLLPIAAAKPPAEIRETAKTGKFFEKAGDYRLELRAGGKVLATTTMTVAAGFDQAIVNACEPLIPPS
jgi:hypothetical protein